jgi:hypothetical protein
MNWTDKVVIRILMTVAKFLAKDEWKKDIQELATHLSVGPMVSEK